MTPSATDPASYPPPPPPSPPPRPHRSLPRIAASAVLATAAFALAGCPAIPKRDAPSVQRDRATASHAFEFLKAAVAAKDTEVEWRTFSPGFKRRLSEQAGRTVDVGDYAQARATFASNATREIGMLLSSEVVSERAIAADLALLTVRSGNQQATPRFVRMKTWEIRLKGEGQPVSEFVAAEENVVRIAPDGSIQMRVVPTSGTAAFLRGIPSDRIEEMHVVSEWYLDDFGGVEEAVVGGLKGASAPPVSPPRGATTPRPPSRAPSPPPPPKAPPAGGFGSPDGATLR